jgi:hypothetical protein
MFSPGQSRWWLAIINQRTIAPIIKPACQRPAFRLMFLGNSGLRGHEHGDGKLNRMGPVATVARRLRER